jgi:hypothetical protein
LMRLAQAFKVVRMLIARECSTASKPDGAASASNHACVRQARAGLPLPGVSPAYCMALAKQPVPTGIAPKAMPSTPPPERQVRRRRSDRAVRRQHRVRPPPRPDFGRPPRPGRGADRDYSFVSMIHQTARAKARPVMG